MFKNKIPFILGILLICLTFSCRKSNLSPLCWGECEEAVLFYLDNQCAGRKGEILLTKDNSRYLFKHNIPKDFRKENAVEVCIRYKHTDDMDYFTDCIEYDVIKINCIQKR